MENLIHENLDDLKGAIPLHDYAKAIIKTDKFPIEDFNPIVLGLFGEVGSIMATSKKYRREKKAYPSYKEAVEEELGDVLWYFSALCRRLNIKLSDIFESASNSNSVKIISANDQESVPIVQIITSSNLESIDSTLIDLGCVAAQLLRIETEPANTQKHLVSFARLYIQVIKTSGLTFAKIVKGNLIKTLGRFTIPSLDTLPDFDATFSEEEQLPRYFEISITQRNSGQSYLRWNNVFIGSPLTDNIRDSDGYRFHDVFHLAYAAILHWSPTFRALIKQKRKSDPVFDESQDSGRAIVVEEGLTAWLYSYSKGLNYFEDHENVSFDVLKTIQKFVQGYEVEKCPLKLWEDAILQGYNVFRKVRENNGGIVVGDRENRTICYRPLGDKDES